MSVSIGTDESPRFRKRQEVTLQTAARERREIAHFSAGSAS